MEKNKKKRFEWKELFMLQYSAISLIRQLHILGIMHRGDQTHDKGKSLRRFLLSQYSANQYSRTKYKTYTSGFTTHRVCEVEVVSFITTTY